MLLGRSSKQLTSFRPYLRFKAVTAEIGGNMPVTESAQGPAWSTTATTLNDSGKVNKSVVYFDSAAGTYKADSTWTTSTLVDGGNF